MADDKLLRALNKALASGLTEQQVKERLVSDGWNKNDVNGAYALHELSKKPIGSNLMSAWRTDTEEKKKSAFSQFFYSVGLLGLLLIAVVVVDWYGYPIPFLGEHTLRTYIETKVPAQYLPQAATRTEASTTPAY
jgi:hypothetical protein